MSLEYSILFVESEYLSFERFALVRKFKYVMITIIKEEIGMMNNATVVNIQNPRLSVSYLDKA